MGIVSPSRSLICKVHGIRDSHLTLARFCNIDVSNSKMVSRSHVHLQRSFRRGNDANLWAVQAVKQDAA